MTLRRRAAGLTLIELSVVLVIMGLALALAMPFVGRGMESVRIAAGRRRVVSFLTDAGVRAVNTGKPVLVGYDFASNTFSQTLSGEPKPKSSLTLPEGLRVTRVESPSGEGGEGERLPSCFSHWGTPAGPYSISRSRGGATSASPSGGSTRCPSWPRKPTDARPAPRQIVLPTANSPLIRSATAVSNGRSNRLP